MSGGPDKLLPLAVCAPGMRPLATLALGLLGKQVSEVRETRFLEGFEVYLIDPPQFEIPPFDFTLAPPPSRDTWTRSLLAFPAPQPSAVLSDIC